MATTADDTLAGTARWARLASLGLILAAAGPLLILLAGVAWGLDVGDDVAFFGITAAVALLGAFLLRRDSVPGRIVGIVAAVLVALALFWTAFGLFAPASFFDFVPGVLVIPGALIGLIAGIAAVRAHRRGDLVRGLGGGERRGVTIALGALGVLVLLSAVLTLTGQEDADAGDADLAVEMTDFEFGENSYEVQGGDTVFIDNQDPFLHTFTVDDLDIDTVLNPGSEKLVTIPDESGTYVLYCEPHTSDKDDPSDDDMATTLVVR